ncbi:MAG: hypothetical protein ACYCS8_04805 [Acidithiobacillus sp.]
MKTDREIAVQHIREQVARIRGQYANGGKADLACAAVRLSVLADTLESPAAPAWMLEMVRHAGTPTQHPGA